MTAPATLEITDQFSDAYNQLEHSDDNLFITGKAGTGKSTLLHHFRQTTTKNVVVLAPTGVAALNVRGQTIHSFFKFKPRFMDLERIKQRKPQRSFTQIDTLVIDEISMVRADIFDGIEKFMRLNGPHIGAPFGGVQLCVFGDLYQLPPIVSQSERDVYSQSYPSPYFFDAPAFKDADFNLLEMTDVYRQSDRVFITALDRIRTGQINGRLIDWINQRHLPENTLFNQTPIVLCTTNRKADNINQARLDALPDSSQTFEGKVSGTFDAKDARLPSPHSLELKVGAQVMFTKNDKGKRWVNGTIGTITTLSSSKIIVAVTSAAGFTYDYEVEKENWESVAYEFSEAKGKIVERVTGNYNQYPLILAWAVTIHKSQGKTLDSAIIDLDRGAFASGQLYVALSRCRSMEGIILKQPIRERDIRVDPQVVRFMNNQR